MPTITERPRASGKASFSAQAANVNNYMQHLYGLFAVAEDSYKATLNYDDQAMRAMRNLKIVGKSGKPPRRPSVEELNHLM